MTEPPPPPAAPRTSKAALAALILGAFSCLCVPALPGLVVGIIALRLTGRDPMLKGRPMAWAGIALAAVLGTASMFALMALPSFLVDDTRIRQSQCKLTLKSYSTQQKLLMAEESRYLTEHRSEVMSRTQHYRYVFSREDLAKVSEGERAALPPWVLEQAGVTGTCPKCEYLGVCVGNLDGDDELDVWVVSSKPVSGLQGEEPAGSLVQLADDRR
jgi:hypothetical protein